MSGPFELGLALPPTPDAQTLAPTLAYADTAGFSHIWAPDRTLSAQPAFLDALTVLSALAVLTRNVTIGPVSLVASRRNPVNTAHALASVEYLSGGRLTVGVGVSGIEPKEFAIAGIDTAVRGAVTDEYLHLWRRLWGEEEVTHEGVHYRCDDITLHPKPSRHIPVWIAGGSEAAQRRAGRLGDAWIPTFVTPDSYPAQFDVVRRTAEDCGRDPDAITPAVYVFGAIAEDGALARQVADGALQGMLGAPLAALEQSCLVGTPDDWAAQLGRWQEAGVRHVSAVLFTQSLLDDVRLVGETVLPRLGAAARA
ncbi:LLM class flavin-dependent oxidoreductase [Kineosporia sp. R_H_3]|uniref:LLM class flavin-dependent oxidoreductase n=1 Tax=Kineosporia sp. R_H_3 TaxID=1961848 RepID=UPI000B4B3486|nr:LLM class flavin-dependent oxidoreductase [Kineosporia sp. R_H_3]